MSEPGFPRALIGERLGLRVLQEVSLIWVQSFISSSTKSTKVPCRRLCLFGPFSLNLVGFDFVDFGPFWFHWEFIEINEYSLNPNLFDLWSELSFPPQVKGSVVEWSSLIGLKRVENHWFSMFRIVRRRNLRHYILLRSLYTLVRGHFPPASRTMFETIESMGFNIGFIEIHWNNWRNIDFGHWTISPNRVSMKLKTLFRFSTL